jgi:hypothetical protein
LYMENGMAGVSKSTSEYLFVHIETLALPFPNPKKK